MGVAAALGAPAHVAVVDVVEREEVELGVLGEVEGEGGHVGVAGAGAVAGRAVHEDVVEPAVAVEVLAADPEVEEAVEHALALEEEVVEDDLAGEGGRVDLRLRVPAELVGEFGVDAPLAHLLRRRLELEPDVGAEPHLVAERSALGGAQPAAAGQAGDVLHQLLADPQVGPEVEFEFAARGRGKRRGKRRDGEGGLRFHFTGSRRSAPPM